MTRAAAADPHAASPTAAVGVPRTRLFFALWPDDGARAALAALTRRAQAACGGRAMQPRNLHLTLVFLGDIGTAHRDAAIAAAARVRMTPCTLGIDRSGYFRQGRERGIVWAGCETPAPGAATERAAPLVALAADLRAALAAAGVPFDRKAFVPHVTLLRDARVPGQALDFDRIDWPMREFVLVASDRDAQGPVYRIAAGPFGAGTADPDKTDI
jgi:2'-5' RNA ligase